MNKPRLMVVDDSHAVATLLRMLLRRIGDVTTFEDPVEAHAAGLEHHWDLAILDMLMPKMTGLEITASWQSHGLTVPVIIASGYDKPPVEAGELDLAGWLVKPFASGELESLVTEILSLREATPAKDECGVG